MPAAGHFITRAKSFHTDCINEDLNAVSARLRKTGVDRVVSVDLTQPQIGIPGLRVIIPELEGMYNQPGSRPGRRARCKTWL
jgi:ribosomal protein S12 methylthiotransferase accessory factor YcaO